MPSVHLFPAGGGVVFNIGHGVGKGRSNHTLDVLLVQYLLKHVPLPKNRQLSSLAHGARMAVIAMLNATDVDGVCGPGTLSSIALYQGLASGRQLTPGVLNTSGATASGVPSPMFGTTNGVINDGAVDPWTYPAQIHAVRPGHSDPLGPSLTLLMLL